MLFAAVDGGCGRRSGQVAAHFSTGGGGISSTRARLLFVPLGEKLVRLRCDAAPGLAGVVVFRKN